MPAAQAFGVGPEVGLFGGKEFGGEVRGGREGEDNQLFLSSVS